MIDINPNLSDPTDPTRARLIPNPSFEQYYVAHNPVTLIDGHDINSFRGVAVYDAPLPWSIKQRLVFSVGYRHENYYKDAFTRSLSRQPRADSADSIETELPGGLATVDRWPRSFRFDRANLAWPGQVDPHVSRRPIPPRHRRSPR